MNYQEADAIVLVRVRADAVVAGRSPKVEAIEPANRSITAAVATTYAMLARLGSAAIVPGAGALLSGAFGSNAAANPNARLQVAGCVHSYTARTSTPTASVSTICAMAAHGARATRSRDHLPGITSPAITWGFVGEASAATSIPTCSTYAAGACPSLIDARLQPRRASRRSRRVRSGARPERDSVRRPFDGRAHRITRRTAPECMTRSRSSIRPSPVPAAARIPRNWRGTSIRSPRAQGHRRRRHARVLPDVDRRTTAPACAQWLHTCDERAIRASFEGFHTDDIHADMPHVGQPVAADHGRRAT